METVRIKNAINRPRVFSVVDAEGNLDAVRLRTGERVELDVRLLTPEIVENIRQGYLLLLSGALPDKLNPYREKKKEKPGPKQAAPKKGEALTEGPEKEGARNVFGKGGKLDG